MNDHEQPDPAFDSLRSADPAARADAALPDERAVRDHVRSRLAEQAPPARRAPWIAVAAAATAALLIGGTGYFIGSARSGEQVAAGQSVVEPAVPVAPQVDLAAPSVAAGRPAGSGSGIGLTEAGAGSADQSKMMAAGQGRNQFSAQGLSDQPPADGTVSAVQLSPADGARLSAFAATFGLQGEATKTEWAWVIGSQDGTAPSASLDNFGNVYYYDPAVQPYCVVPMDAAEGGPAINVQPPVITEAPVASVTENPAASESVASTAAPDVVAPDISMPMEPCEPATPVGTFDQAAAESTINAALTAAGLDPAGYSITWSEESPGLHRAQVDPGWVDSDQGWSLGVWSFAWFGSTLMDANGSTGTLADVGTYPLVSPTEAVERLSDPRFGTIYPSAMPEYDGTFTQPPTPPAFTGGPIPWPVADMVITDATLKSSVQGLTDGTTIIAPTYRLSTADGYSWDVIAIADSSLAF